MALGNTVAVAFGAELMTICTDGFKKWKEIPL